MFFSKYLILSSSNSYCPPSNYSLSGRYKGGRVWIDSVALLLMLKYYTPSSDGFFLSLTAKPSLPADFLAFIALGAYLADSFLTDWGFYSVFFYFLFLSEELAFLTLYSVRDFFIFCSLLFYRLEAFFYLDRSYFSDFSPIYSDEEMETKLFFS